MTKIVLTFGLIAGAILGGMMLGTLPFMDRIGFDRGEVIGYTTMVVAFMLVFFGIRSYRDNVAGGSLSFAGGLKVGLLITAVASACYVATWQLIYYQLAPDFAERQAAHMLEKERMAGASKQEIAQRRSEMQRFQELYQNPFVNIALTVLEVLPVGGIVSAVSAAILRRRRERTVGTLQSSSV